MARDKYHQAVREALEKDGWTITHDPFRIKVGTKKIEVDLGAEKLIAAEKGLERIVVEVKSFLGGSMQYDFYEALGQFSMYRRYLRFAKVERPLFLAMPEDVFDGLFNDEIGQATLREENLKLLVFQPEEKKIVQWIKD